jgi:hypothetical protein
MNARPRLFEDTPDKYGLYRRNQRAMRGQLACADAAQAQNCIDVVMIRGLEVADSRGYRAEAVVPAGRTLVHSSAKVRRDVDPSAT